MRAIRTLRSKEDSTDLRLDYREFKCDPWDQIEHLQKRIAKALEQQKKQKGIELLFEPGTYRDKSSSVTYSNEIHPLLLLEGVTASVGLPLRWHGINFLVEQASMLAELDGLDDSHRFSLVIRAAHNDTSDVLKHFFSRTRIACLSQVEAERLLNRCMEAIDYWEVRSAHANAKTRDYALERLQIFIEVLARVSVRAVPELAKKIFRKVCGLIAKPQFQHLWLFDSLRHLTSYSLGSIPESQHPEILFDALSVPLQSEISSMPHLEWPNPVINNPGVRLKNPALDRRIDEIIDSVTASSAQRRRGLLRLLPLCRAGYLTSSEASKLTERIWGNTPDYTILPETELFSYVFLDLPSQHPEAVKSAVNNYLFSATPEVLFDATMLRDIAAAGQGKTRKLFPTRERAEDYFEKMVHWRPTRDIDVGFKFSGRSDKQIGDLIGKALSQTVVPSLPVDSFTENNFAKLCAFYSEVGTPEVIIAFSYFAAANEVFSERVERFIRQGLQERVAHKVASASRALLKWREMQESPATARLGLRLIYAIGSNRMAGLSALLWTAREMFSSGFLSKSDVESLAEILPIIFDNADYQRTSASDEDAVSASLVRAECVRLSRAISDDREVEEPELMRILVEALQDPLPEVRFSLDVRSQ
jgi:hypothetical protein